MAWLLIAPIYLAARTHTWITQHFESVAMKEAAWANAVAAEQSAR